MLFKDLEIWLKEMSMITIIYRIYLHNFLCLPADVLPGKVGEEFCCVTALVGGSQGAQ